MASLTADFFVEDLDISLFAQRNGDNKEVREARRIAVERDTIRWIVLSISGPGCRSKANERSEREN